MKIEVARKQFQRELVERAVTRSNVKSAEEKAQEKTILAKLNEILELLKKSSVPMKPGGPVKFIVTERDLNGKIKSFKVEG